MCRYDVLLAPVVECGVCVMSLESIQFYDIRYEADSTNPSWFDIERVYCFEWNRFSPEHWDRLNHVYSQLPEYCINSSIGCPRWYSEDDDITNGFLTASVEPPGLQVFGTLRQEVWQDWDCRFRAMTTDLPARDLANEV
jgi:hypothetical protein